MAISREDLKKKRLEAMGVVGAEMDASAAMYGRVIDKRTDVAKARQAAEAAHMGALRAEIADLEEMAEEMAEFAQAVPTDGGTPLQAPAAATAKPSAGSDALAALNAAQPNPKDWEGAYETTHPPKDYGVK